MYIVIIILIIFVLWFFIGGKKRREDILTYEIRKLIYSGNKDTVLRHVYFEAALKYALEHGGQLEPGKMFIHTNSILFMMNIDGEDYMIFFSRCRDDSAFLSVETLQEFCERFSPSTSEIVKKYLHQK